MAIDRRTIEAVRTVGGETGMAPEVLLAVALVETRAVPLVRIGRREEPLIRFEGHYFDRQLPERLRPQARAEGLSHPRAGRIASPAAQPDRWALFQRAVRIDAEAACASVSWGLCQVMGAHAAALGFRTAEALASTARSSILGQVTIGARFLALGRLADRLMDGDFPGFARRYNGPGYRRNRYDEKIAAALERARSALHASGAGDILQVGARGPAVLHLQTALRNAGASIAVDGIFGPRTRTALETFQRAAGMAATGFAGAETRSRLGI
ncbi:N-acetylmuramidase domain-containing protein [Fulvimarina sp. 2208YS6-2-32]|uniref:N-acetylmuramidase domain-containing protein n=1 Tax=Fulvimarina uroteuthidis TaxID=3098149 RepID=A0ABU5HZL0_9HYPH|nr:N-acetylmuramidase domain-containing protein [Fulvimarina sp. 2208YS6-2-32]MDY8108568.1 N-acetylmuramidase domain-containing protein [Fulvimarina sp. 2208YS6-2-32]